MDFEAYSKIDLEIIKSPIRMSAAAEVGPYELLWSR